MNRDHTDDHSADGRSDAPTGGDALQHDALAHDDFLRRALHDAAPQPPIDDVDWRALHARIRTAAQPSLAGLAAPRAGADVQAPADARRSSRAAAVSAGLWQPLAGWSPFGIPLAAAATVVLMIGAALLGAEPVQSAGDDLAFRTIEEEFVAGLGGGAAPLIAGAGSDDLLDAVLFYGEDW